MSLTIQDDMAEVIKLLPKEQQGDFAKAIILYGCDGIEPDSTEPWFLTFFALKPRLKKKRKKTKKKKKRTDAKRTKNTKAQVTKRDTLRSDLKEQPQGDFLYDSQTADVLNHSFNVVTQIQDKEQEDKGEIRWL